MNIKDAKVLVTGGSSGLGYETAKLLISKGAKVAICGRKKSTLEKAAKELGAIAIVADVSIEAEVINMIEAAEKSLDGLHVLINNAGFGTFAPLLEVKVPDFEKVINYKCDRRYALRT
jgi:3-oxoacyl-[acyl-carrier protein] reductase